MQAETTRYYGYTCEYCEQTFTVQRPQADELVHCPECGEVITSEPQTFFIVTDTNVEQGFYECFDCGHLFGYSATELENTNSVPNCTECGSDNTELLV